VKKDQHGVGEKIDLEANPEWEFEMLIEEFVFLESRARAIYEFELHR
jgi:hypothetical protein